METKTHFIHSFIHSFIQFKPINQFSIFLKYRPKYRPKSAISADSRYSENRPISARYIGNRYIGDTPRLVFENYMNHKLII